MAGDTTPYVDLVTSEHRDKPKFVAMLKAITQAGADHVALIPTIPSLYDLDGAINSRLDTLGVWVGIGRTLSVPIPASTVFFSFDTINLGLDQGIWGTGGTTLVFLPDEYYRLLIKARILNNHWNSSKEDAYTLMASIFNPLGYDFFIADYADLTIGLGIFSTAPPKALANAMLKSGLFDIKPAGIKISKYITQSALGPIFAFDINNTHFAGFDQAAWATITTP